MNFNEAHSTDHTSGSRATDTGVWAKAHETRHDPTNGDELGTTVIFAVAAAKGVDPLDADALPPLSDVIDVDALSMAFLDPHGTTRSENAVTFTSADTRVRIHADGWVHVYLRQ